MTLMICPPKYYALMLGGASTLRGEVCAKHRRIVPRRRRQSPGEALLQRLYL